MTTPPPKRPSQPLSRTSASLRAVGGEASRLAPEHVAWLKELSVALHRRAAYPPGHPARLAGTQGAREALERTLEGQPQVTMIVSRDTLTVDGRTSDPSHPVFSDLAERLHRAHVSALTLLPGVEDEELDGLLSLMLPTREGTARNLAEPIGEAGSVPALAPSHQDPGPHVRVGWLRFDTLALAAEEDGLPADPAEGDALWQSLAAAALLGQGDSALDAHTADPTRVLAALRGRLDDPTRAAAVTGALLNVARHVRRHGRGAGVVAARLRAMLADTGVETFEQLLRAADDPDQRRRIILQGIDVLPVSSVLDWVAAAARCSDRSLSDHLRRLLGRLAGQTRRRADRGPDEGGEAIRQAARALVEGWSPGDVESDGRDDTYERLFADDGGDRRGTGSAVAGAERIVQMALELDAVGPDVIEALESLVEANRPGVVVDLLERAPHAPGAVAELEQALVAPALLRRVLLAENVATEVVSACLARCGPHEAEPLLDVLALSEAQATRLLVIEALSKLGEAIRPALVARLPDAGPYLCRNLLSVIAQLPDPPEGMALGRYLTDDEPLVRAEALRVAARLPRERDAVLAAAFADRDVRVQRTALDLAVSGGIGRSALPPLLAMVQDASDDSDLRVRGIPLLAQAPTPAAREWLQGLVRVRKGILFWRRWALAPRTPQGVAALRALALGWSGDPAVRGVLELARGSADPALRDAARARGGA